MIVVSNTSPIFNLAAVGQLELLRQLYGTVVIPPAVHEELVASRSGPSNADELDVPDWIEDDLIAKAGFWISQKLYDRALQAAGE